jgi:hypothetical protein
MFPAGSGTPIPSWALPYLAAALAVVSLVFCVLAIRAWQRGDSLKARIGNLMGYGGFAMFFATFSVGTAFRVDLMPTLFMMFIASFITIGIGGTLAGWKR